MKRIQIDLSTLPLALLLICAGWTAAISQTRAPDTVANPNVAITPRLSTVAPTETATAFEFVVSGQSQGTFRSFSSRTASPSTEGGLGVGPTRKHPMEMSMSQWDAKGLQYITSWHREMLQGRPTARRNVTIIVHRANGTAVETLNLTNAFPIKLTASANRAAGAMPDETLEIECEAMSRSIPK